MDRQCPACREGLVELGDNLEVPYVGWVWVPSRPRLFGCRVCPPLENRWILVEGELREGIG